MIYGDTQSGSTKISIDYHYLCLRGFFTKFHYFESKQTHDASGIVFLISSSLSPAPVSSSLSLVYFKNEDLLCTLSWNVIAFHENCTRTRNALTIDSRTELQFVVASYSSLNCKVKACGAGANWP